MKAINPSKLEELLNCSSSTLIDIWTIQSLENWPDQKVGDYYTASWNHKDSFLNDHETKGFDRPYVWLRNKLESKGFREAPIWGWIIKPNIREYCRDKNYKDGWILVHAKVPKERLVLSFYDAWHNVLNNGPFVPIDKNGDRVKSFEETQENIEFTWDHVFVGHDTPKWMDDYGCKIVQACVDRIYLREIQSCSRIHGRKLIRMEK